MNVAHNIHRLILLIVLCCMGTNNAFAANKYLVTNDLRCDSTTVDIPTSDESVDPNPIEFSLNCSVTHPTTKQDLSFDIRGIALPFVSSNVADGNFTVWSFYESPKTRIIKYPEYSSTYRYGNDYMYGKNSCLCKIYKPALSNVWIRVQEIKPKVPEKCNSNQTAACPFTSYAYCAEQCMNNITSALIPHFYTQVQ